VGVEMKASDAIASGDCHAAEPVSHIIAGTAACERWSPHDCHSLALHARSTRCPLKRASLQILSHCGCWRSCSSRTGSCKCQESKESFPMAEGHGRARLVAVGCNGGAAPG
jgi:hypothetical protein